MSSTEIARSGCSNFELSHIPRYNQRTCANIFCMIPLRKTGYTNFVMFAIYMHNILAANCCGGHPGGMHNPHFQAFIPPVLIV